jgi:hypothetical protein
MSSIKAAEWKNAGFPSRKYAMELIKSKGIRKLRSESVEQFIDRVIEINNKDVIKSIKKKSKKEKLRLLMAELSPALYNVERSDSYIKLLIPDINYNSNIFKIARDERVINLNYNIDNAINFLTTKSENEGYDQVDIRFRIINFGMDEQETESSGIYELLDYDNPLTIPPKLFNLANAKRVGENYYSHTITTTRYDPIMNQIGVANFLNSYFTIEEDKANKRNEASGSDLFKHRFYVIVGIDILVGSGAFEVKRDNIIDLIKTLKAFSPSCDSEFHKQTECSTTKGRLCIYETYNYFKNGLMKEHEIKNLLAKEPEDIKAAIKGGRLAEFLVLKSRLEEKEFVVKMFRPVQFLGFSVFKGEIEVINDLKEFNGKEIYLWEGQHVAPGKAVNYEIKAKKEKVIDSNLSNFSMSKIIAPDFNIKKVMAFDAETFFNTDGIVEVHGYTKPYNICVKGTNIKEENITITKDGKDEEHRIITNDGIREEFCCYNEDPNLVVDEFIEFLDSITTKFDLTKTRDKVARQYIHMYGFNNSRFDNLLFFTKFKKLYGSNVKEIIAGNSIKYIEYFNLKIFDLNLYYAGSLNKVAGDFKLDVSKDIYPYEFALKENLRYKGEPPLGWKERDEYIKLYGNYFDMEAHTIKYCMMDCHIALEVALKHIQQCIQPINKIKTNNSACKTAAGIALNTFKTCFIGKTILRGSPKDIQAIERESFKGGRTGVAKPRSLDKLIYVLDINSAHPSSMKYKMPIRMMQKKETKEIKQKVNTLIPHYLYHAKSIFKGSCKNVIPNLLIKGKNGSSKSYLETEYAWHWGAELIEAIHDKFEITTNGYVSYSTTNQIGRDAGDIFCGYVDTNYNERLIAKAKETKNEAKSEFLKLLLNSLYGKFSESKFTTTQLIPETQTYLISSIIASKNKKIVSHSRIKDSENNSYIKLEYEDKTKDNSSVGELVRFSSYITAQTRCKLARIKRAVGHEHIYYFDTDSIYTDKNPHKCFTPAQKEEFLDEKILGKWKVEEVAYDCYFDAAKSYTKRSTKNVVAERTDEEYFEMINEITCRNKGIAGKSLTHSMYGKNEPVRVINSMFIRGLEGVRIINQERTKNITYQNSRIFDLETNSSRPFERANLLR